MSREGGGSQQSKAEEGEVREQLAEGVAKLIEEVVRRLVAEEGSQIELKNAKIMIDKLIIRHEKR